jgi:hypothetical protein
MFLLKLVFICFLSIIIACNPNGHYNSRQNKNSADEEQKRTSLKSVNNANMDTIFERKQLVFKKWLFDTLKIMKLSIVNFNNKAKFVKKEVSLTSDSLALSVNLFYNVSSYASTNPRIDDVQKLLSLLKEYDEYPKGQFALKFKTSYFFTPSPVPEMPYDMTFDLDYAEVIEKYGKEVSRYEVVRGRIGSKHITNLLGYGKIKQVYVNFLWKDGELIKEKRN